MSPSSCGCVIELFVDTEDESKGTETKFLLMNTVCDKHVHLASTQRRANHQELAKNVMDMIEEAKRANIADYEAALKRAKLQIHKRDVERCKPAVEKFNADITEEWNELVSFPHAFDSHIHKAIMSEQAEQQSPNNG